MRRNTGFAFMSAAVVAFACIGSAWAQTSPVGAKIGFVSSYDVLYNTDEGKQALDKLNRLMQEKQQAFDSKKANLDKLQLDFQAKQGSLNAETRNEMARTIEEQQKELTRFQEDAQAEITRKRDEYLGVISDKAQKIIADYAEKNSFGAIFLRDPQFVAFIAPAMDVTQEIIKLYNQQHAAPAAAPAPAAPKPGGKD
jgi:outer membrane protein